MMNKKNRAVAALLLMLMLALCACGETAKPADEAVTNTQPVTVQEALKDTTGISEYPGAIICDLLGLEESDYPEIVYFDSEDGVSARCVIVLTGKDKTAADTADTALNRYLARRMKETQNYLPDEYQLLKAAKVERKNNTVVLIVGADAAEEAAAVLQGR